MAACMDGIKGKMARLIMRIRLQPIRVFCFHEVSDEYNPFVRVGDWMQTDDFKKSIGALKKKYCFITLQQATEKLNRDKIRIKRYAVLTADDGYKGLGTILPWLESQNVPITLFLNARYLNGEDCSPHLLKWAEKQKSDITEDSVARELYLTHSQIEKMKSPFIGIASHGYEHLDATAMSQADFQTQIERNIKVIENHLRYVPFHAYTWGRHNAKTDSVLKDMGLIPVLMDGEKNYRFYGAIHRELLRC